MQLVCVTMTHSFIIIFLAVLFRLQAIRVLMRQSLAKESIEPKKESNWHEKQMGKGYEKISFMGKISQN